MTPEIEKQIEYLDQIAQRSRNGEIDWARLSAFALMAKRSHQSGGNRTLVIQSSGSPSADFRDPFADPVSQYLLQVLNGADTPPELSLNSQASPHLRESLEHVFQAAEISAERKRSRILKEVADT